MSIKEQLKKEVEKNYKELHDYSELYNSKSKESKEELMTTHKLAFAKDPESVDMPTIARDIFYINGFYQADIRKLQTKFLDTYTLVTLLIPSDSFSEDIQTTANVLKSSLPKQLFVVEDKDLVELEEGKYKALLDDFKTKNYFKMFEESVKTILNG